MHSLNNNFKQQKDRSYKSSNEIEWSGKKVLDSIYSVTTSQDKV